MKKIKWSEISKSLRNGLEDVDYQYRRLFDRRLYLLDLQFRLEIPDEWDVETLIEKAKYCVKNKIPLETFPEWQKYKKEEEIENTEFLKGLEDCDWD